MVKLGNILPFLKAKRQETFIMWVSILGVGGQILKFEGLKEKRALHFWAICLLFTKF